MKSLVNQAMRKLGHQIVRSDTLTALQQAAAGPAEGRAPVPEPLPLRQGVGEAVVLQEAVPSEAKSEPEPLVVDETAMETVQPALPPRALAATHHPIFRKFRLGGPDALAGQSVSLSGSLIRQAFFLPRGAAQGLYPPIDEEYFEWIDMLEAIADADSRFVMAELGAGYGRWVVHAACIARRHRPDMPVRLIAVEAEPEHFGMMRQHFLDNGVDPAEHTLIEAAVNGAGGEVYFAVGHATDCFGQCIMEPDGHFHADFPHITQKRVKAVRLEEVLRDEPLVDLVDMDIQGAEGEVIAASLAMLNEKVRRLHIETHSHAVEDSIFEALSREGWHCSHAFRCQSQAETHYGRVDFQGGVQSWLNPRLFRPLGSAVAS